MSSTFEECWTLDTECWRMQWKYEGLLFLPLSILKAGLLCFFSNILPNTKTDKPFKETNKWAIASHVVYWELEILLWHDFSITPAIIVSLTMYSSLKYFAIKFRRWGISKQAPLSCNLNHCTLVSIPLDSSYFAHLSSLLWSMYCCPVSTGNTTTLSGINSSHISVVMMSFCLFVCPFTHFKSNPWQEKI